MSKSRLNHVSDDWVGLWDRENPKSVWSRTPGRFRKAMDGIPDRFRQYDEKRLFRDAKPTSNMQDARHRFWDMFAAHETARIPMQQVFNGVHSTLGQIMECNYRMMWFLTPPLDFALGQRSILERTMTMVRDALSENNLYIKKRKVTKNKDGSESVEESEELNTKALSEVRKLMDDMTDRVQGTSIQRVAHIHGGNTLDQLTSAGAILDAASDEDTPPMLEPGEQVEVHDRFKNDLNTKDPDPEDFIADFMDDPID